MLIDACFWAQQIVIAAKAILHPRMQHRRTIVVVDRNLPEVCCWLPRSSMSLTRTDVLQMALN